MISNATRLRDVWVFENRSNDSNSFIVLHKYTHYIVHALTSTERLPKYRYRVQNTICPLFLIVEIYTKSNNPTMCVQK